MFMGVLRAALIRVGNLKINVARCRLGQAYGANDARYHSVDFCAFRRNKIIPSIEFSAHAVTFSTFLASQQYTFPRKTT
jgi:hypothetical protein